MRLASGILSRFAAATAAALLLATAQVGPLAPAPAEAASISDPLTGGSSRATRVNGGRFSREGWTVTNNAAGDQIGQYLFYLLPSGTKSGSVEFEAKGFVFSKYPAAADNREHIWGVFDRDGPHDAPGSQYAGFNLRLYDHKLAGEGTFFPGSSRLRFFSPSTEDIDADRKGAVSWDRNKWYRFRFEWSQTGARWFKDGKLQSSVRAPNQGRSYRYLYVGSDHRRKFLTPVNITYRNVRISSSG